MAQKGQKYYKYIDGNLYSIRLGRLKNNKFSARVLTSKNSNEFIQVSEEELKDDYILLNPDGYITFCIVKLYGEIEDVIVTLHRNQDMFENALPYAVCRQSVSDIFTQTIIKTPEIMYVGCSVSQDTCPEGVDFRAMTSCNEMESMDAAAVYMDDTLDTILSFINVKKYNNVLTKSTISSIKSYEDMKNMTIAARAEGRFLALPPKPYGYENELKDLLIHNDFMYDFYKAFGINIIPYPIDNKAFKLSEDNYEANSIALQKIRYIEDIIRHDILAIYVTAFNKTINLKEIKRNYMLAIDSNDKLWIIAYDLAPHDSRVYNTRDEEFTLRTNARLRYKQGTY